MPPPSVISTESRWHHGVDERRNLAFLLMNEESLIRHYLPAISAFVGFVLMALFFPFAEPADRLGESFDLKAQVAGAQSIPAGDGLKGTYFQNWQCSGATRTRNEAIYFPPTAANGNDQTEAWKASLGQEFYDPCIKWSGQIYIEGGTADYTFFIAHDDHVALRVNGTKLYEASNWSLTPVASTPIRLESKHRYDISIDFYDSGYNGYITLGYSGGGSSQEIVPQKVLYSTNTQCSDGVNNDNDQNTDFPKDPGCESAHDNNEGDEPLCMDGRDNDGDGKIDHPNDPGCSSLIDNTEGDETQCEDKTDNDGDGRTDLQDPGCSNNAKDDNESDEPACQNNKDDEGDGKTDMADPGCKTNSDTNEGDEALCKDGKDNDGDGKTDMSDPGCTSPDDETEGDEKQCEDKTDNDGDGRTDLADPGCNNDAKDDNESNESRCQNNKDDDGDGATDFPNDPGCSSVTDDNESDESQCRDKQDNDADGRADFAGAAGMPKDPGCLSLDDADESDEEACQDTKDNDKDGKIDYPDDVGCLNAKDNSEENPQCSDGLDNDKDEKIDLADKGCETDKDDDEKNQIIGRDAQVSSSKKPKLIILPSLEEDEKVTFKTDCKDCVLETSKDPALFIGGTTAAKANFSIIGTLVAADKTQSHTIVVVGNYAEQSRLFSRDGVEYTSLGENSYAQYFPSFLAGEENNYAFKIKTSTGFELVKASAEPLLPVKGGVFQNGSLYYFLLSGTDSEGKGHLMIVRGRYWDLKTLKDKTATPEAVLNLMNAKGSLPSCVNRFKNLSEMHSLFTDAAAFQMFLDLLSLCQR